MPAEAVGHAAPSPFSYSAYRELWSTNAASNIGTQVQVVGAGWLMASLTNSPQFVALMQTAVHLPAVLFILIGGAVADNHDRRTVMLLSQSVMLALATTLAALTWLHLVTPLTLLALTFLMYAFSAFNNPFWHASVRDILPRALISQAVALNSMSMNLARSVGPAVGGVIVAAAGAATAFAFNAASFLAFIIALLRWKPPVRERSPQREPTLSAIGVGIRYVAGAPLLRNAVVRAGISGLSASAPLALLPVFARQQAEGSAALYGALLGIFGLGAMVSAWIAVRMRQQWAPDHVVAAAVAALASGLLLLAWSPLVAVALAGAALCGFGWVMAHTTYNTTVQLGAPPWVTARALALYQTATFGGMAIGSAIWGAIAERYGVPAAFATAAAAQATGAAAGLRYMPLSRPPGQELARSSTP